MSADTFVEVCDADLSQILKVAGKALQETYVLSAALN